MIASPSPSLGPVVDALSGDADFIHGWLGADERSWLTRTLGLEDDPSARLRLCRPPREGSFFADVSEIASYIQVDSYALAVALREAAFRSALSQRPEPEAIQDPLWKGAARVSPPHLLLEAASDYQMTTAGGSTDVALVRQLARTYWAGCPEEVRARLDLRASVTWCLPMTVVTLPHLTTRLASQWLHHRAPGASGWDTDEYPARGLLLAWRGHGVVLLDGNQRTEELVLTLAHEVGHFLLDYMEPRRRIVDADPELLDVLDGLRPASKRDRARAALAGLALGPHFHFLSRDSLGGSTPGIESLEGRASAFAIELLSPWEEALQLAAAVEGSSYTERIKELTTLLAVRFDLPLWAAHARATVALMSAEGGPNFFER